MSGGGYVCCWSPCIRDENGIIRQGKAECLYIFYGGAGVPQALEETAGKLLAENQPQLAEEYVQLWEIFCGVLDQLVGDPGGHGADG